MFRYLLVAAMPLVLGGCAVGTPPEFLLVNSPTDSGQGIRNSHHHSVLGAYEHRVPVGPKSWRQLNDSQAPGAGAGS